MLTVIRQTLQTSRMPPMWLQKAWPSLVSRGNTPLIKHFNLKREIMSFSTTSPPYTKVSNSVSFGTRITSRGLSLATSMTPSSAPPGASSHSTKLFPSLLVTFAGGLVVAIAITSMGFIQSEDVEDAIIAEFRNLLPVATQPHVDQLIKKQVLKQYKVNENEIIFDAHEELAEETKGVLKQMLLKFVLVIVPVAGLVAGGHFTGFFGDYDRTVLRLTGVCISALFGAALLLTRSIAKFLVNVTINELFQVFMMASRFIGPYHTKFSSVLGSFDTSDLAKNSTIEQATVYARTGTIDMAFMVMSVQLKGTKRQGVLKVYATKPFDNSDWQGHDIVTLSVNNKIVFKTALKQRKEDIEEEMPPVPVDSLKMVPKLY